MRIALLTLEDRTGHFIDDNLAIAELRRRGWVVDEIPWRNDARWDDYACAVVRTTWDYYRDPKAFLAKLAHVSTYTPLWNPFRLIRWNHHKSYLHDLEQRGVRIVPTRFGTGLDATDPEITEGEHVVKPLIGANSHQAFVLGRADLGEESGVGDLLAREWMLQPFVRSVLTEGEHSLFYFDRQYSHAVLKRPRPGDFRVQEEHGGEVTGEEPAADLRRAAEAALAAVEGPLLQARVDLVRLEDGTPALMELELIEPSLYFRFHPDAPAHFADALEARVG